ADRAARPRGHRGLALVVGEGRQGEVARHPVSLLFAASRPDIVNYRSPYPGHREGGLMFTIWGAKERFCDGTSRRGFLQIGAFGAARTLADMLRLRADGGNKPATNNSKSATCKSAILIYLPGGPSHMDMYDLKPDAPKEFRGEFNPIKTNVEGVSICEHFP